MADDWQTEESRRIARAAYEPTQRWPSGPIAGPVHAVIRDAVKRRLDHIGGVHPIDVDLAGIDAANAVLAAFTITPKREEHPVSRRTDLVEVPREAALVALALFGEHTYVETGAAGATRIHRDVAERLYRLSALQAIARQHDEESMTIPDLVDAREPTWANALDRLAGGHQHPDARFIASPRDWNALTADPSPTSGRHTAYRAPDTPLHRMTVRSFPGRRPERDASPTPETPSRP